MPPSLGRLRNGEPNHVRDSKQGRILALSLVVDVLVQRADEPAAPLELLAHARFTTAGIRC